MISRAASRLSPILAAFLVLSCDAVAQGTPHLLTASEFAAVQQHLAPDLVPGLSGSAKPDPKQAFIIPGTNGHSLRMVPVKYNSLTQATGLTNYRCGIFFSPENGPTTFVPTIGYDFTEVLECGSLSAVGFMSVKGEAFPRLLLVYDAGSINGYGPAPVILDYSNAKGTYVPNEKLSTRTYNHGGPITIARMKQSLRSEGK